jgi:hypothetical protein
VSRAATPALAVLAAYAAWIAFSLVHGHGWRDFALVGRRFVDRSTASAAIDRDRPYATTRDGYDGQFFLYIAQDPRRARHYIDYPNYRYSRIGYPIAARSAALGRQSLIPAALVAVNVAAVVAGTFALALWLRRRGTTAWLALVYGFHPAMFVAVLRDLSEALAYGLTALAIVAFDGDRPRRLAASAALFAAAILTRETTVVFLAAWAAILFLRNRRRGLLFSAAAAAPYVAWKVFVTAWLGTGSAGGEAHPTLVPFGGFVAHHVSAGVVVQLLAVVLPATFCAAIGAWALLRRRRAPALWALVANWLLFVVLLPREAYAEYVASVRVTFGVVLAFLLALPMLTSLIATRRPLFAPAVAWLLPWLVLLPTAFSRTWR